MFDRPARAAYNATQLRVLSVVACSGGTLWMNRIPRPKGGIMIAGLTVADLVRPAERRLARFYDAALIAGGSVVIALCAQIAIGYPVPITGQTFAVLMVAALLGSRRGVLCLLAYLAEGLLGLPVFAQGKGGVVAFLGPTGGYLVGFVFAAWIVGVLSERTWDRRVLGTVAAMVLGTAAIYACGLIWLLCLVHLFAKPLAGGVLAVGLYPFLVGDLLKVALAAALLPSGWKILRHFRLDGAVDIR
jgi:biotin transport system substrate-specific component